LTHETRVFLPLASLTPLLDTIAVFSGRNSERAQEDDVTLLVVDVHVPQEAKETLVPSSAT
jgi:hypothetical protein